MSGAHGQGMKHGTVFPASKMKHILFLLLVQFFFKFAQGQGPGDERQYFSIPENVGIGYEVGHISILPQYTYHFSQDGQAGLDYFSLNSITGLIISKREIDREAIPELRENKFDLLVLGRKIDNTATYPIEISIEVLDENDNAPQFPKTEETVRFRENSNIGTQQIISTAIDPDFGLNAKVTDYKIIGGNGPFSLIYDPKYFGEVLIINTTGKLDRETKASYYLQISAIDKGTPPRTGYMNVNITIEDENDNQPVFDPSTYYARVNETDPVNTFVIQVIAKDADIGVNQDITYQFVDVNEYAHQFRIDQTTGEIFTTTGTLQCPKSTCFVTVEAEDGGAPSYTGRAFVYINIDDTNNHDPVMTFKYNPPDHTEFSSVNEDAKDGEIVGGVTVIDEDSGANGQATVAIIAGNELNHFRMQTYGPQALIFVNGDKVLDRERNHVYNLTLEARDGGNPPRKSQKAFVIYVNDINDHAPVFSNKYVTKTIIESLPVGSFVASMVATDNDTGINAKLTYRIVSGIDSSQDWFHLNAETGLVTTKSELHYEMQNNFKMNISVHDGAVHPLYDYAEIEIRILDENEPPKFSQSFYDVSLDENTGGGALIVLASAVDLDSGKNGTVTYKFHDSILSGYPNTFHLDATTGTVTTSKALDREQISAYTLQIFATDGGTIPLSSMAVVNLKVKDINDNVPIFYPQKYYVTVLEGQEIDIVIAMVTATDRDEGENGEVLYSLYGDDFGKFTVDEATGEIKTIGTLKKQMRNRYTLTVKAVDRPGRGDGNATVEVSVISTADLIPTFTKDPYRFTIPEDLASQGNNVGSNIGSVRATVPDGTSQIIYSLVDGDQNEVFTLDSSTGWLKRNKQIDREIYPSFELKIVATVGSLFGETTVNIMIEDLNDNAPVFESPVTEIEILEDSPVGHHITVIQATDSDAPGPNSRLTYSLQRDPNNIFGIENDTGLLYLNKPVKILKASGMELHTFEVMVMDNGSPVFSAKQEVHVKIVDVNDYTPKFPHSTYELSLIESTKVNHQIQKFEAFDADMGDNAKVVYNITRGNEDKAFGVFPDGVLYVARTLDRETKDLYKLTLLARDKGLEPRSSECNITIHITDENDNKPIFINATFSLSVYENKPKGTFVGYIRAMDMDMGRNAELSYYLDENQMDFKIDSQTGELTTLRSFDRERLFANEYIKTFDAVVKDNGHKRLQDIATVRVHILDENDSPPKFNRRIYKAYIFENAAVLSNVTVIKAEDPDDGLNSVVTYSVVSGNEDERFKIGQTTGQITVNGMLDRETEDFYELSIVATDSGKFIKHSATATVQIHVKDTNDNYPLFAQTSLDVKIKEDVSPGKEVAYFTASDIDLGVNGEITYALHGKDDDGTFGIDSHTGRIYLLKPLDYERKQLYHMNVSATDNGNPKLSNSVAFNINVEDVNDNAPEFRNTPYRFNIIEHSSGSVNQVIADDADFDKNGEIHFHIAFQDPPGDHFKIVKSSGQLYIDKPVDREVTPIFRLTVVATDQAEDPTQRLSSETIVTIIVDDVNDNSPQIISCSAIKVPLSTPRNEFLTTIKARDLDTDQNGRVSLQLIQNNVNKFGLESNSGRFYLSQSLSPTPVKYSLEIQASDYGQPSQRTTLIGVTVIVTDDNEGPLFRRAHYSGNILENSVTGKSILSVEAVSHQNSRVEYYVTNITLASSGVQVGPYFQVDKTTGVLSAAEVLDRETMGDSFIVEIYAIDVDGDRPRTSVTQASVQVLDANDTPPRFSQNYYTENVQEDVELAATVAKVTVTDDDTIGGLQLTISEGGNGNFRIHPDGSIVTTSSLDQEKESQYTLKVMATDGIQSSFCYVRLTIDDVNDNAPMFDRNIYSFDISEDTPLGTTIGGVSAHDPDTGAAGIVRYSLTSAWGNDTFLLDPVMGTFKLLRVLDFEENWLYTLSIKAEDNGSPPQSSEVLVYFNIIDANDNMPLFEPASYDSAVFENVTVGTSLLRVIATDVDSGDNGLVTYAIIDGNDFGEFRINPFDGTIYNDKLLDRETTPVYSLVVMATDMANPPSDRHSSTAEVLITLKDINDFKPVFTTPAVIFVKENIPHGTEVHTIQTEDLDDGINGQVEYRIVSASFPFTLGTIDGKLRVNTDLDLETVQNYSMIITATDKGEPALTATQTLVIKLTDDNDHSPVFDPASYSTSVREDVKIGTILLHVSATDLDIGLNGVVRYYVVAGDNNQDFSLDQSSGALRVQKSLDFERLKSYSLTIQAEDSGENVLFATTTVTVTVLDVNDNTPVFLDSPYIGFVRENMGALPVYVMQVQARDGDENTVLQYAIREGAGEVFSMNNTSGEIMALKSLDREQTAEYVLTVIATDSMTGRALTGTGTVSIFVEDTNDNPPVFEHNGNYTAHITEESPVDTEVVVVMATDADEGSNAQIIYTLTDTVNGKFQILPTTGRISTGRRLDREEMSQYVLEVVARDGSAVPLSTTTTVIVHIDDINDNAPTFDKTQYTQRVMPPITAGSFITGMTAIDADIGNNGLVLYSLQQTGNTYFNINSQTGVITATQSLSPVQTYQLTVRAEDKGAQPKSSSVHLIVEVLSSGSGSPPVFNAVPTGLKVIENIDLNTTVTTVTANGGVLNYYIVGGNTGQGLGIDQGTGRIYVSGTIDYEVVQQYRLWVEARQSSTLTSFKEVIIDVEDKNDNWPRFTQTLYNVSIYEDAMFPSTVVTVKAVDTDSGENGRVSYSLLGQDAETFRIDQATGTIITNTNLDRENTSLYSFTVRAVDNGIPQRSSTASVRVNILDVNDNSPIFTRQFSIKIPENLAIGSFVLQVTSSDADTGVNAVALYSLSNTDGTFSIDATSGNITLLKPLDAETNNSYTLRVTASDGAHEIQVNVEIEVSDVNDNIPVLLAPYSFDFPEKQPAGSIVGQLIATDADIMSPNNEIYFSLKLPSPYFDLDSDTGEIFSLEEMEYHAGDADPLTNRHELLVIAKDLGTPVKSSEMAVYINIVDYNNHAPLFEKSSYASAVPYNLPLGSSVLTVVARDEEDLGRNAEVEYFLTGGNGSSLFHLDRYSGIVSVSSSLSGKRNQGLFIIVKAEDKGMVPQSSSVTVLLTVTGMNNYSPQFVAPGTRQITVPEDKAVGSLIETFSATDQDDSLNAEIVYEISGGDPDEHFELNPDTGKLTVRKELDYEKVHEHTLNITARDKGLLFRETSILYIVRLNDVNDNAPVFTKDDDEVFIEENSSIGTFIYRAVATDKDTGNNSIINYAIVGDSEAMRKFKINEKTGFITSKGSLDYETKDSYMVMLMALDGTDASRKSTMNLMVSLIGMNEYIPQFEQDSYYFSISESAQPNTSVGKVTATDLDSGEDGIVYYFLVGESNLKGFKINPKNGEIIVSGKPDYESSPRIALTVLAKNWGSVKGNDTSACTVHISVQDANDPPEFTSPIYQASIPEGSGAGTSVVKVTAEDYDPTDRDFAYVILDGNTGNLFQIDSQTGLVKTTGNGVLDREVVPIYNITVGAVDTGSPPMTGSAIVQIHLDDINDNGPYFISFTAKVAENQNPGSFVTSLIQFTRDPDGPGNQHPFTYRLVPGSQPEYQYFDIGLNSGNVTTKRILDREQISEFVVPVIVQDGGQPPMSSTLSFTVHVLDINDNAPTPRYLTAFVSLYEGRSPENAIANVKPADEDIDGMYSCNLVTANPIFSIPPSSCELMLNGPQASAAVYTIEVEGSDGSQHPFVSYEVYVKVLLFDNNTLDNSVIIQINDMTADSFLESSYTNFIYSVQKQFDSDELVVFYGVSEHPEGDLLLFLAVKRGSSNYFSSDIVKSKISAAKSQIQSEAGVFIVTIGYSDCSPATCKNNGECVSHVTVSPANHIADSRTQSLSNPSLGLTSYCRCLPQFTGPDCSQAASPCGDTYCQNGGDCVNIGNINTCQCPATWTGNSCESDINECDKSVCQNRARCENLQGSFICHCRDGFSGIFCEEGFDHCEEGPCERGTCNNTKDGFTCECPYSNWGDRCQFSSSGFKEGSYMEFSRLMEYNNEIEVIFATNKQNALLLYNPSSDIASGVFIALEILEGKVRFSVNLGTGETTRLTINKQVANGYWYKVKVNRNRNMSRVWVNSCPEDGGECEECQIGTACYGQGTIQSNEKLEVGNQGLTIGGVRDINTILNRTGQVISHDFVGCMRSFIINGQDKLKEVPLASEGVVDECPRTSPEGACGGWDCKNGGVCVDGWERPVCQCTSKYSGVMCEKEVLPFGFSPDTMVTVTQRESYRRDQLIAQSISRRRRATLDSSVFIRFRTQKNLGLLLFTSVTGGSKYSVIAVVDGQIHFNLSQYGKTSILKIETSKVSDGEWHNVTVTVTATEVKLNLDGIKEEQLAITAFGFTSLEVKQLSLGGASSSIKAANKFVKDFHGCISKLKLDGSDIPLNGTTDQFVIMASARVENGCSDLCAGNPCDGQQCTVDGENRICAAKAEEGPLSIGIIVVIIFFIVLLLVIVILFLVFKYRRPNCMKGKKYASENGNTICKSANSSGSHPDSGFGENHLDEFYIRNHINQELNASHGRQNGNLNRPDIIESDKIHTPLPFEMVDGTVIIDNASDVTNLRDLNGDVPEHYDLENASSIAPSDIDIVDHYRHFHNPNRHRKKESKPNSQHSSHHSHHSAHTRDNPGMLSSVPFMNDLTRNSPNPRHSPMNQLSRHSPNVQSSPLTHVNMRGMPVTDLNKGGGGSRATSEHSLASHRSKNSSSVPQKPKRQMLPNGHPPNSNLNSAVPLKPLKPNYEKKQFLTLEEVDRLNSRPRESPASLMEAFSTSSENNTRKVKLPFQQYPDTSVLLEPPESSSEDSANDSFTCSEFEYDNDKPRNDFDPTSRIFSNLAEEENETDEAAYNSKSFRTDGLDSGGNSFSSNVASSDEGPGKPANIAFNWDDLLNWGPKFEKLVGVFTDIALLPDGEDGAFEDNAAKSGDKEEYV